MTGRLGQAPPIALTLAALALPRSSACSQRGEGLQSRAPPLKRIPVRSDLSDLEPGKPAVVPSIKGSLFGLIVNELREHLDAGRIPRAAAEAVLRPDDFALIEQAIRPGTWYPIEVHERVLSVLYRTVGEGRREYLVDGGRRAADALADSGLYAQLEVRGDPAHLKKFGRILVTLSGAAYSFSSWNLAETDDARGRFTIEVKDAAALGDLVLARAEGFAERAIAIACGGRWQVTSRRPDLDRVLLDGWRLES